MEKKKKKNAHTETLTGSDGATGRIEVHVNRLGWILGLKEKKLSNDNMGSIIVNGSIDANDALFQQP